MCGLLNDNLNVIREALTNALTDLTQPFDSYTPEQKEQKRAEYIAALAALEEAAGWEMLPNGDYMANSRGATFTVDGEWLTTRELALDGNTYHATIKLPANVRLRKRQPAQEGGA